MSHQVEESGVHQVDIGLNSVSVLVEATQKMSQGKSRFWLPPASCHRLFWGGAGSQGVIRVKAAEFTKHKQTKIWSRERRPLYQS